MGQLGRKKKTEETQDGAEFFSRKGLHQVAKYAFRDINDGQEIRGAIDLEAGTITLELPLAPLGTPCPVSTPDEKSGVPKSFMLANSQSHRDLVMVEDGLPDVFKDRRFRCNITVTTAIDPNARKGGAKADTPESVQLA